MYRKVLIVLFLFLFGFSACARKPVKLVAVTTELDDLFVRDFKDFEIPELKIKSDGEAKRMLSQYCSACILLYKISDGYKAQHSRQRI